MDRCNVKGTHVLVAREWIDARLGEGTFRALIDEQPSDWPKVLLPASWYDVDPMNRALHTAAARLEATVEGLATDISRENARRDLRGVYRAFLRVAGPHLVMNATSSLWRNYVNFGVAKKLVNERGHYVGQCSEVPARLVEWSRGAWRGFVPTAIELAGGRGCVVRVGARADSPAFSTVECEVHYQQ